MLVKSNAGHGSGTVPLHLRFGIGRKALTELLVSMRPQTAVAIGPHYLKRESQAKPIANNNHPNQ
jgi:hypothetical protein